jgi:hypothetical protein
MYAALIDEWMSDPRRVEAIYEAAPVFKDLEPDRDALRRVVSDALDHWLTLAIRATRLMLETMRSSGERVPPADSEPYVNLVFRGASDEFRAGVLPDPTVWVPFLRKEAVARSGP